MRCRSRWSPSLRSSTPAPSQNTSHLLSTHGHFPFRPTHALTIPPVPFLFVEARINRQHRYLPFSSLTHVFSSTFNFSFPFFLPLVDLYLTHAKLGSSFAFFTILAVPTLEKHAALHPRASERERRTTSEKASSQASSLPPLLPRISSTASLASQQTSYNILLPQIGRAHV